MQAADVIVDTPGWASDAKETALVSRPDSPDWLSCQFQSDLSTPFRWFMGYVAVSFLRSSASSKLSSRPRGSKNCEVVRQKTNASGGNSETTPEFLCEGYNLARLRYFREPCIFSCRLRNQRIRCHPVGPTFTLVLSFFGQVIKEHVNVALIKQPSGKQRSGTQIAEPGKFSQQFLVDSAGPPFRERFLRGDVGDRNLSCRQYTWVLLASISHVLTIQCRLQCLTTERAKKAFQQILLLGSRFSGSWLN